MSDVEQFGSWLDTMVRTDGRTKYANSMDDDRADKNNKRERLHVFIHRRIHKNILPAYTACTRLSYHKAPCYLTIWSDFWLCYISYCARFNYSEAERIQFFFGILSIIKQRTNF